MTDVGERFLVHGSALGPSMRETFTSPSNGGREPQESECQPLEGWGPCSEFRSGKLSRAE
jgi:hypothetical protein